MGDYAFTLLDISVRCKDLPNKDMLSQTDAFCVLNLVPKNTIFTKKVNKKADCAIAVIPKIPQAGDREIGRTDVVRDSRNPDFTTSFEVEYRFEKEQRFVLRCYDEDVKGDPKLSKHDYLGACTFTLSELMGSKGNSLVKPLGVGKGKVMIRGEEQSTSRDVLHFHMSGAKLKNKDGMFGKSDPFLVIARENPRGDGWNQVWKSEVVMDNLSPNWKPAQVPLRTICNGDVNRQIQFTVYDWDQDGQHDSMGCVQTTVQNFISAKTMDVLYSKKKKGKVVKTEVKGHLIVHSAKIIPQPTFIDYISGGCEISLAVAVDFTASNNDEGLHNRDPRGIPNDYQAAIISVGEILQDYDTDKRFPIYGFGAKINDAVSHCFQVGPTPEVYGVQGLLDAYASAFVNGITLYGPTKFGPIIEKATDDALVSARQKPYSYSVLLILTDGEIHDMGETIDLICRAAEDAPLSIIIVGVGSASFAGMEALDGDGERGLRNSRGVKIKRDIVQFVSFRQYRSDPAMLAAQTLAEVPKQIVDYFMARGMRPQATPPAPSFKDIDVNYVPEMSHSEEQEIHVLPVPY